jgi:hypothetical protein
MPPKSGRGLGQQRGGAASRDAFALIVIGIQIEGEAMIRWKVAAFSFINVELKRTRFIEYIDQHLTNSKLPTYP